MWPSRRRTRGREEQGAPGTSSRQNLAQATGAGGLGTWVQVEGATATSQHQDPVPFSVPHDHWGRAGTSMGHWATGGRFRGRGRTAWASKVQTACDNHPRDQ